MPIESFCSNPKRLKLDDDITEINVKTLYINNSSHNCEELLDSPMNSCEQVSISSAFDQDSSSILSGSICESNCEIYSTETVQKGILKSLTNPPRDHQLSKHRIKFQDVEIFYFNRQQSFCSVPSIGGSALGMEMQHFLTEKFDLNKDLDLFKFSKKLNSDFYDIQKECGGHTNETYSILQPIVAKHRRILLKNSGTSRIETVDKEICDLIRSSRERCGCQCVAGQCVPETCICSQNGIQCQVDRGNFPCGCGPNPCSNPLGRVEFNPIRVRTHFIHTIMRLQMQDQYQSEESADCYSNHKLKSVENIKSDQLLSKEFDMSTCNSTNQGSCRDCQNDKYLQVLMNEWTNQLQKLHPTRQYQSNLSLPYDSWTYGPEMFCSSIYCSKDFSTVSFLPYSNYTINSLSGLNVGTHQVDYNHNPPQIQYRQSIPIYQPECLEQNMLNFNSKCKNSEFSLPGEPNRTIDYSKHHHDSVDSIFSKQNDISPDSIMTHEHVPNHQVQSSSYMSRPNHFQLYSMAKCETNDHFPYQSRHQKSVHSLKDACKYDIGFVDTLNTTASKQLCYNSSEFVNTIHYSLTKTNDNGSLNSSSCDESVILNDAATISWSDDEDNVGDGHNPRIATASNGQLYTVLQPVSQSGIVSTFYQNSQAIDSCKICKFKSPDTRQRLNSFCVSDFSMTTDIYHQTPIKCTDKSEVCA